MARLTGDLTLTFDDLDDLDLFKTVLAAEGYHVVTSEDRGLRKVIVRIDQEYSPPRGE